MKPERMKELGLTEDEIQLVKTPVGLIKNLQDLNITWLLLEKIQQAVDLENKEWLKNNPKKSLSEIVDAC